MLKSIFKPSDCARCRLCCNFHQSSVWESPYLPPEQAQRLHDRGIPVEERSRGGWSFTFHFQGKEAVNCPMLNETAGCTFSSEEKPFECSIWPLRIMRQDDRLLIGYYRECPALAGEKSKELTRLACGDLLPVLLDFAEQHPHSVRDYSKEYEVIWHQ